MLTNRLILLCLLLLLARMGSAQPERLNFVSLSTRDGLLSNTVNAIIKDRYGLMWFATDDGLNKYNGTNFTVYRHIPGDSTSLRANEVLALHEDKAGNLWIGTSHGGLSRYDRKKDVFVHYPIGSGIHYLPSNAVIRGICSDRNGNVWIAQYENLFMLDPASGSIARIDLSPADSGRQTPRVLTSVFADSKQRVWIGSTNGLYLYDQRNSLLKKFRHDETQPLSVLHNDIWSIAEDRNGQVWVGTPGGLCVYRSDGSGFDRLAHLSGNTSALSSNEINCIARDATGNLWIGTSNGLNVLNIQTQTVTTHLPEEDNIHSLTHKSIRCIYIDNEGIYWLGTARGGINKYDRNLNLFNCKPSNAFSENSRTAYTVSAFAAGADGTVFVGTDGGGLYTFNRRTEQISPVNLRSPLQNDQILSILALHRTHNNRLYVGTYAQGLLILDLTTGARSQLKQGSGPNHLSSNDIFCIEEDSRHNIWLGTNGQGVVLLKNDQVITRFKPNPDPSAKNEKRLPINGYIRAIEEDSRGNIWIGTHGGGIAVYNLQQDEWTVYTQGNSRLAGDKVEVILCDRRGNMWIGTYGEGLSLFDPAMQSFVNFSEKDGLQNTTIYQLIEDLNGLLWLSTNTGISSFDLAKKKFRNYTHHNGIQNSNFARTSGIRLPNGELFFGGLEGFNYFNPAKLTINGNVPEVLLTDLRISNKSVTAGEDAPVKEHISVATEIRLDYKQNFAISFVALNYTIPKQNHYAYMLEGFDKDWIHSGTVNTASYTNLDPGEYTFHVKAANNDGVWSTTDTVIKIFVKPPFWRTTWAYIIYVVVIGGLLLYSRYRGIARIRKKFLLEQERQETKRIQELDRLKIKFLTNLSHDFRTPISLIMGPVDQLIGDEKTNERLDKLNMIRRNARRLLNLVNQLLDFRKMEEQELKLQPTRGELVSFIKEVTDSFRDFAERKNIRFRFTSQLSALDAWFDHNKMERILFNLLSNAFKFTLEDGSVAVELLQSDKAPAPGQQWISIKVTDTGIGIPEDKKDKVFELFFQTSSSAAVLNQGTGIGLSITKEFIRLHGGTIAVDSEPGKGTAFTIHIPLRIAEKTNTAPETAPAADMHQPEATASTKPEYINEHEADLPLVLLVEDNDDFRFYLKDNLRNHYKVLEAANGREGWQKALGHHPQLIVSDISMPQMDGIELVKKLKADKRTSHIPVILLTALTAEEQQIAGLVTGANDYITKPFNFEVLNARIKNLLRLNETLKSTYSKQIKVLSPEVQFESADEKLLEQIVRYLEDNLTNPQLSVERLSEEVGMSRSTLYSKLLELTGQSPVEYIRSYRLDKAAILLEKSNMTIAQIAYEVGFSSPNYFARSFKNKFNMLPSEFIGKIKKG